MHPSGLSGKLWAVHLKPKEDELFSCWIAREAHAQGVKVQTFCDLAFGKERQIWNRDIDRLAPTWLVDEWSRRTAIPADEVLATTLHAYQGLLYREFHPTGFLKWILPLKMYHRKRMGFGLQFCPSCLSEDEEPFFRKRWRVAFNTMCPIHGVMLHDRCPNCGAPVIFHRLELGKHETIESGPMSECHACHFDLREAEATPPSIYDDEAFSFMRQSSLLLEGAQKLPSLNVDTFAVLHQLCKLMITQHARLKLREFVLGRLRVSDIPLEGTHFPFELRPIWERHHVLQLAWWLVADLENRLTAAWKAKAVRYNMLFRDFEDLPKWYGEITAQFSNWRGGGSKDAYNQ